MTTFQKEIDSGRNLIILSITDTRSTDSDGKPIPGSGVEIPCSCCGKTIEIHSVVSFSDVIHTSSFEWHYWNVGVEFIIGKQCAKKLGGRFAREKNGRLVYSSRKL